MSRRRMLADAATKNDRPVRQRRGSLGMLASETARYPPGFFVCVALSSFSHTHIRVYYNGPSTLSDCVNFVETNVGLILRDSGRRDRLSRLLSHSALYIGSDFTGINCTNDALTAHLRCVAHELNITLPPIAHTRSCDVLPLAQQALKARDCDAPNVLFGNFFDRIPLDSYAELRNLEPPEGASPEEASL